ncbi:MAG: AmmeMemoRadiSam system radical SAM enzyme [Candidatus Moranbacteria bacterium]|nr:AmmeMemoRadiSam system radical SAM enzyme [Candidatus Moranbacteria bacterium]
MKESINYKKLNKDKVQCLTCSHYCQINKAGFGICGVRKNLEGKLYFLLDNRPAAMNIDPIEKKPLYHFLPGSKSFSLGTLGCNFRCDNCHNFDISQADVRDDKILQNSSINLSKEEIIKRALQENCKSISYTYNEPTIFLEYAFDIMKLSREKGLKNVWVSNGFMSDETLEIVAPYLDAINIDIKSMDEEFYLKNCSGRLEPVLNNAKEIVKKGIWLEITTLIIPGLSDDKKMLESLALFIKKELGDFVPWHLSAFSPEISWKLTASDTTSVEKLKQIYNLAEKIGLKYVYAGNIFENNLGNTICPVCEQIVIKRNIYDVARFDKQGKCPGCKNKIQGIFN